MATITPCKVERAIDALSGDDADTLRSVLSGRVKSASAIAIALREEGIFVSPTLVRDHRRRVCACYLGSVVR